MVFVSSIDVVKQLMNLHMAIPSAIYKEPELFMIVKYVRKLSVRFSEGLKQSVIECGVRMS